MANRTWLGLAAVAVGFATIIMDGGAALASESRAEARLAREVATAPPGWRDGATTAERIRMVLAAERAALETLSTDRAFAHAGGMPGAAPLIPAERSALADQGPDLEILAAEDEVAAALARGASDEMIEELLLGDATGAVDLAAIERIALNGGGGDPQWRCLAEAIYFEARSESLAGQVAVGEVVLNRVDDGRFPNTICGVVKQGADGPLNACQFSYECDGAPEAVTEPKAFATAGKIAQLLMGGRPRVLTQAATFYHATYVKPSWARRFVRTARIGEHIFYRRPTQLSSN